MLERGLFALHDCCARAHKELTGVFVICVLLKRCIGTIASFRLPSIAWLDFTIKLKWRMFDSRRSQPRRLLVALFAGMSALSSACVTPPPAPTVELEQVSGAFRTPTAPLAPLQAAWWTGFDDPILTDLVEMALRDSPTLTASDAIIDQTEILLRRARLA